MIEHRRSPGNGQRVVTVACPFCDAMIDGNLPHHLRSECSATQRQQQAADEADS